MNQTAAYITRTLVDQKQCALSEINIRSESSIKICARSLVKIDHDTTFRKCSVGDNS